MSLKLNDPNQKMSCFWHYVNNQANWEKVEAIILAKVKELWNNFAVQIRSYSSHYMMPQRSGRRKRMLILNYIFQTNFTCSKYLIENIWEYIYFWRAQKLAFCTKIQGIGALNRLCTVDVSSTLKLQKKRRLELIFTWKQQITQVNCLLLFLPNTLS